MNLWKCGQCSWDLMRFQWLEKYLIRRVEYWYMLCSNPMCKAFEQAPRFLPCRLID